MTEDVYGVAGSNYGEINQQFIYQSSDYQTLCQRIKEKQEFVAFLQEKGETDRALKAAAELEELEQELQQFKDEVFRLYEIFTRIEIDTERLAQAKEYFDQGQFREADAILNAELMAHDLEQLIERERQLDQQKEEIHTNRIQLSKEYLIKARLRATRYDQVHRFDQVCTYFEASLNAARTPESLFGYALFLYEHNAFIQAKPLYTEALDTYRTFAQDNPKTYLPDVANTLNNLAVLQSEQNDYTPAKTNYTEALDIRRTLAQVNSKTYLPDVANTLNNLAVLQRNQNDYTQAEKNYTEALGIQRALAKDNPKTYLSDVANLSA